MRSSDPAGSRGATTAIAPKHRVRPRQTWLSHTAGQSMPVETRPPPARDYSEPVHHSPPESLASRRPPEIRNSSIKNRGQRPSLILADLDAVNQPSAARPGYDDSNIPFRPLGDPPPQPVVGSRQRVRWGVHPPRPARAESSAPFGGVQIECGRHARTWCRASGPEPLAARERLLRSSFSPSELRRLHQQPHWFSTPQPLQIEALPTQ